MGRLTPVPSLSTSKTMRYRCLSCKEVFEIPDGDRARCPKCLRVHDVEPLSTPSSTATRFKRPIVIAVVVLAAVGAYAAWYLSQEEEEEDSSGEGPVEIGPLSAEELWNKANPILTSVLGEGKANKLYKIVMEELEHLEGLEPLLELLAV